MIKVSWQQLKQNIVVRTQQYIWTQDDNSYIVSAFNGPSELQTVIAITNPPSSDQVDFETNFKAGGNQPVGSVIQSSPPFGSKTIIVNGISHSLFARFTGAQYTVTTGSNTLSYTATYTWAKMLGIEVVNGQAGDYADLKVYDTAAGTYSGVPNLLLNQFSYTMNIASNYYSKMAQFDTDLYAGMVVQITYNSITTLLPRFIGVNFLMNEVKTP